MNPQIMIGAAAVLRELTSAAGKIDGEHPNLVRLTTMCVVVEEFVKDAAARLEFGMSERRALLEASTNTRARLLGPSG